MCHVRPLPPPIADDKEFLQDGATVKSHPVHMKLLCVDLLKELRDCKCQALEEGGAAQEFTASETDGPGHTVDRLIAVLKEVCAQMPDQWDAHEELVKVHCDMRFGRRAGYPPISDSALQTLRRELLAMQRLPEKNRAPFLAEMLLLQLWTAGGAGDGKALPAGWRDAEEVEKGVESELAEALAAVGLREEAARNASSSLALEMLQLLTVYVKKFENKQCCFNDIKQFLGTLSADMSRVFSSWAMRRAEVLKTELRSMASGTDSGEGSESEGDVVKVVTDKLCRLSKLLQITYFLELSKGMDASTASPSLTAHELLDLYCSTHAIGAGKGVGGLREVQPGDELLMLCSTLLRRGVLAQRKMCLEEPSLEVSSCRYHCLLGYKRFWMMCVE